MKAIVENNHDQNLFFDGLHINSTNLIKSNMVREIKIVLLQTLVYMLHIHYTRKPHQFREFIITANVNTIKEYLWYSASIRFIVHFFPCLGIFIQIDVDERNPTLIENILRMLAMRAASS